MGGSFNPVHYGHLVMAESVRDALHADGMLFIPAREHPLKSKQELKTSYQDRLHMVSLAISGNEHFLVEEPPDNSAYTIDLIRHLKNKYPSTKFFLPIGSDIVGEFHKWYRYQEIEKEIKIVIASRPGYELDKKRSFIANADYIEIPKYDIASRDIRQRIKQGRFISYMVPDAVAKYIMDKRLYLDE